MVGIKNWAKVDKKRKTGKSSKYIELNNCAISA